MDAFLRSAGWMLIGVDKVGSTLEFFDPEARRSVCRLQMPVAPHDLVLSADQSRAYVTIYGGGRYGANPLPGKQVLVVDLVERKIVDSISLYPFDSPHGITFDRRGLLWVTSDRHARVLGLSTETHTVVEEIGTGNTGTHWILASPFEDLLFCSNKDVPMVTVIDPREARLVKQIKVPHGTEGMAFGADGTLFAADHKEFKVLVIDRKGLALVQVIHLQGGEANELPRAQHMRLAVSAAGDVLAVAAYDRDLLILVDLTNTARQRAMRTGRGPMALAFAPAADSAEKGLTLYLSNHDEGTLSLIDVERGSVEGTFACGQGIEALACAKIRC